MAQDAISLHIRGMLEDGENIPLPSKFEAIMDDSDYSDATAIFVLSVPEVKPRSVRVNITMPQDMLRKIDNVAKKIGMSRSSFLIHAAQSTLTSVALKLRRAAKNAVDSNEIPGFYAHPNDRMKVIHEKVGHHCIGKMQRFVRILKADSYVQQYVGNRLVADVLSFLANVVLGSRDAVSLLKFSRFDVQHIASFKFTLDQRQELVHDCG